MIGFNGKFSRKKKASVDFNNKASVCALGHSHGSMLETSVCQVIQLRERAGELKLIQVQATVYMSDARYRYIPDFKCLCVQTGEEIYIEAKGFPNQRWPTTKKLWKTFGPGRLEIWTGSYRNPQLTETIVPVTKTICKECGK